MKCLIAFGFALSLAGQEPRFGTQSRLVQVPITVTDAKGRSIDGLEAPDFIVLDEGRPQKAIVDTFATGVAPISLVVAVQSSGISIPVLEKVRRIGSMIQPLITGQRGCAALVSFAERVDWRQECTNDPDALTRAFGELQPGKEKSACMLDAAREAIDHLRQRRNVRRVLLLISESRDRGSEANLDSVILTAQAAGVTVYAATYSAFATALTTKTSAFGRPPKRKEPRGPLADVGTVSGAPPSKINPPTPPPEQQADILGAITELKRLSQTNTTRVLATVTGGATFPFTRQKGLEDTIAKLGGELHTQYVLSFTPEAPAPGYHKLEVKIAGREDLRIRARPGYWATW